MTFSEGAGTTGNEQLELWMANIARQIGSYAGGDGDAKESKGDEDSQVDFGELIDFAIETATASQAEKNEITESMGQKPSKKKRDAPEKNIKMLDKRSCSKTILVPPTKKRRRLEKPIVPAVKKKAVVKEKMVFKCFLPECRARFRTLEECNEHMTFRHTAAGVSLTNCLNREFWDDDCVIHSGIKNVIENPEPDETTLKVGIAVSLDAVDLLIEDGWYRDKNGLPMLYGRTRLN